jgi:hypothetical protein
VAFLNTSAATTWPAFYYLATAALKPMDAVPVAPANLSKVPALQPTLEAVISNTAPPSSVEWQVSTVVGFGSTVWTTTQTSVADGRRSALVGVPLTNGTTYYWRVRTGDGLGAWGPWSPVWSFGVDTNAGRAYQQVYENVGREAATPEPGFITVYENVGMEDRRQKLAIDYLFENVGVPDLRTGSSTEYMYWGDVSANTPNPRIWFLDPASGRAGDGITLVCFGVGDLAGTYAAVVEYLDAGAWHPVPVVTWQTFGPTAAAYTAARTSDPELGVIDPQHTNISIVVPAGARPPGYPSRVRTEGP